MSPPGHFERLSPNISPTGCNERLGVVFHHSVLPFEETIELMANPASEVSYHCLIAHDGTRCTLAVDTAIAWHAGASTFRGRPRCNDFMLGVSFAGDTYVAPLSDDQLRSAREWWDARKGVYGWSLACATDHRQVSPGRKNDLNPVEWDRLVRFLCS